MTSASFFTTLLSGGLFLLIILLYIFPRIKKLASYSITTSAG
jgi:hypothetical protein